MFNSFKNYLFLIVIVGAILRLVSLTTNPPSLNWDEVSHGYNAYSILKTGSDEWGKFFPLSNFRAYGDYPLALNLYLTIPFIAVLGLTELAIRLPHAVLGILTIVSAYFVGLGLTKKKQVGLLMALLVAVGPWYVFTSRFVLQSNLSVFLLTTSLALFLNREKSKNFLTLSILALLLTLFSYHTTRIFTPLLIIAGYLTYKGQVAFSRKQLYLIAFFFVAFAVSILSPASRARSQFVFLVDQAAVNRIIESRQSSTLPPLVTKLLYNRPTYFATEFTKNYISYFSPKFLFFKGGTQYQFSVPNNGLIYGFLLPLFYLGVYLAFKKAKKGDVNYRMILAWLILSPIPASITKEAYAVVRATPMLPIPEILVTMSLFYLATKLKDNLKLMTIFKSIFFLILALSVVSYLNTYFGSYKKDYSWSWQYGYKEVVTYAKENYDNYAKIVVTKKYGEPHEFFLFYLKWDPKSYKADKNLNRFNQSGWWWVDGFDKFYFVNDWEIPKEGSKFVQESKKEVDCRQARCLLITSPGNAPTGWTRIKEVNYLDGVVAFELYEN